MSIQGQVKSVQSGNVLTIAHPQNKEVEKKISLAFVNVPLYGKKGTPDEPFGFEAREFVRRLAIGKNVTVDVKYTLGNSDKDFCVVTVDGQNLNAALVKAGLASFKKPKVKEEETGKFDDIEALIEQAESDAKKKRLGVWSEKKDIKTIVWNSKKEAELYKEFKGKTIQVVVEHVASGNTIMALFPSNDVVSVQFTGIQTPKKKKVEGEEKKKKNQEDALYHEAKEYTESKLAQREVTLIVEDFDEKFSTIFGTVSTGKNSCFSEELLVRGLATINEHSVGATQFGKNLRTAQGDAQSKKLKIWTNYAPTKTLVDSDNKTLNAKIVDIKSADTLVIKFDGVEEKVSLSSIRGPAKSKDKKENDSQGFIHEAKEFIRKRVVGKPISIKVDYRREFQDKEKKNEKKEIRRFVSVTVGGKNLAVEIVNAGFATVIKHSPNEERSPVYDQLLKAESDAEKAKKGVFGNIKKHHAPLDLVKADDLKLTEKFAAIKDKKIKAVVQRVLNGSRLILFCPTEQCVIQYSIAGVSSPALGKKDSKEPPKPYAKEAQAFTLDQLYLRDVDVCVEKIDKTKAYSGPLTIDGKVDFAVKLVENGFATMYAKPESKNYAALLKAETSAKEAKKNIFSLPQPERIKKEFTRDRKEDFGFKAGSGMFQVRITEIRDGDRVFLQTSDSQGPLGEIEHLISSSHLDEPVKDFQPKERDLVFCQFTDDGNWYRARIMKIEKGIYSVFYVDFGNQEKVKLSALRPYPRDNKIPPQAKEASLAYIRLHKVNKDDAYDYVSNFCLGKDLLVRHEYSVGKKIYITIFDAEGKFSLNADLIRNGLSFVATDKMFTEQKEFFEKPLAELHKQEEEAKKEKLNLWLNGDIYDDDEEFEKEN